MSEAALLRPGIVTGDYPEREDERVSLLDRLADGAIGFVRQRIPAHRTANAFVAAVKRAGADLERASEADLALAIRALRVDLQSAGLRADLVARSFALIREIAGRRLGMRHFEVQLAGGQAMLGGKIVEMETGEGKTLTATLPAATAALAGIPVHVVTVNDFLVTRDAAWMKPVYEALGISVGTVVEGAPPEERRRAYRCDVTYCTNKQIVFDYLRDRLLLAQENRPLHRKLEGLYRAQPRAGQLLMRGLCFAIVDEADSVLIDEARTPLIISRAGDTSEEERTYRQALDAARRLRAPRDYQLRDRDRHVDLTDLGRAHVARLTSRYGGVWASPTHRQDLVKQALAALHFYILDKHYIIDDGRVRIVDEYTGRVMADRSWERGLHQMIEAKEGLALTGRQETLARISYQRFFRRYLRLAGMTGTAREVAGELWAVYRLGVVRIPTNRPTRRKAVQDLFLRSADAKWQAIVERITALHRQGLPVLVGTRSVAASEHLSRMLDAAGIDHRVLNARQNKAEADIVAQAGEAGRVTVATNMAGRGTDIKLGLGAAERGGLYVIATERHDARRIDRQLFGRCGRQGDPGCHQAIVSVEDELFQDAYGARLNWLVKRLARGRADLPLALARGLFWLAQVTTEMRHSAIRRQLLRSDESLEDMLAFSGRAE